MKRLTERIVFLQPTTTADDYGGFTRTTYTEVYECWANVQQSASNREFQSMQNVNMVGVDITMRYAFEFVPSIENNISWRGKLLTIHGSPDLSEKNIIKLRAWYDPAVTIPEPVNES
jgi:SPP1 family predicted phage head-tail adaptor